jgi:hypothetical protein
MRKERPIRRLHAPLLILAALASLGAEALGVRAQTEPPTPAPRPRDLTRPAVAKPASSMNEQQLDPDPVLTGTGVERRARIRICAEQWIKMKKTGAAYGNNWRDFSRDCYARPLPAGALPRGAAQDDVLAPPDASGASQSDHSPR